MARTKTPLSIGGVTVAASTGAAVSLRRWQPTSGRYSMQVVFANSTKAKVKMQGSIDGVNWKDIGTALSTVLSNAPFVTVSTAIAYTEIRAVMTSRTTKAPGPPTISVFVNGA